MIKMGCLQSKDDKYKDEGRAGKEEKAKLEGNLSGLREESSALMHAGNYHSAIGVLEQRLKLEREIFGKTTSHEDVAITLGKIGECLLHMENYGKSQLYLFESLNMWKILYPDYTRYICEDLASLLSNLGNVCEKNKDFNNAVKYHEEALRMKKAIEAGVATGGGAAPARASAGVMIAGGSALGAAGPRAGAGEGSSSQPA
ncbi:uncharacterized protein LOC144440512 [Glandiceps talaboti]